VPTGIPLSHTISDWPKTKSEKGGGQKYPNSRGGRNRPHLKKRLSPFRNTPPYNKGNINMHVSGGG